MLGVHVCNQHTIVMNLDLFYINFHNITSMSNGSDWKDLRGASAQRTLATFLEWCLLMRTVHWDPVYSTLMCPSLYLSTRSMFSV